MMLSLIFTVVVRFIISIISNDKGYKWEKEKYVIIYYVVYKLLELIKWISKID